MKKKLFALLLFVVICCIGVYADDEIKENIEIENNTEAVDVLEEGIDAVENITDKIIGDETEKVPFEGFFEKYADNMIVKFFKKIIDTITELISSVFEAAGFATMIEEVPV